LNTKTIPPSGTLAVLVDMKAVGLFKIFKFQVKSDRTSGVKRVDIISDKGISVLILWNEEEEWWYEAALVEVKYIKRIST
jgi:hypothetical protein